MPPCVAFGFVTRAIFIVIFDFCDSGFFPKENPKSAQGIEAWIGNSEFSDKGKICMDHESFGKTEGAITRKLIVV